MRNLFAVVIFLCSTSAYAVGTFELPAAAKAMRLKSAVGQGPVETRIKLIETLEQFRLTSAIVPLGGKNYHASIQTMRDGNWVVALIPEGMKKFDVVASYPLNALRKSGGYADDIGGTKFKVSLAEIAPGEEAIVFTTPAGAVAAFAVEWMKYAVWEKGAPIPALGPEWRFIFQIDLWVGAGMRTFGFLEKTQDGVRFHGIRSESVASMPLTRIKQAGDRKVSVVVDEEGKIVIRPVEE